MNFYRLTFFMLSAIASLPLYAGSDEDIRETDIELAEPTSSEPSKENDATQQKDKKPKHKKLKLSCSSGKDIVLMSLTGIITFLIIPDALILWGKSNMINTASPIQAFPFRSENGTLMPPVIERDPECIYEEYIKTTPPDCTRGTCLCIPNEKCYCYLENCDKSGQYKKACKALSVAPLTSLISKCAILVSLSVLTWVQCTTDVPSGL